MKKACLYILVLLFAVAGHADDQLHPRERYRLHIGDSLDLNYRLTPEFNQSLTIQPDGYASLNVAGDLKLEGLTMAEAHDLIVQKDSVRLNQPELNLVLSNFQKPYIVVGGAVSQPGRIELRENLTAMQAIVLAGGFSETARDSRVIVFRHINSDMGEVHELDLHNLFKSKNLEKDMALQSGDMILVPVNRLEHFSRYMRAAAFSSSVQPQGIF